MDPLSGACSVCGTINQRGSTLCVTCGKPLPTPSTSPVLLSDPSVFSPPKRLLKQRYSVIRAAGKGGMGTVYIGRDTYLGNRLVAIKAMSQSRLSPLEKLVAAKNFEREAHLLAGIEHPHLPSIYDYFEEAGHWYLVMSFVRGQTLDNYLDAQCGRLPVGEVLEIGIVLCDVLHYLHTRQTPIIFRDLKPSNIMRTGEGHIYLIDFGVARFFKPGQTKDTSDQGTSGYAAPEQYGTAQTTPRSDIYSLGITLYELLSGYEPAKTPFHFPPLQELVPTAPTPLVMLITQMLDLDERKRPHSADMVKQELQNISKSLNSTPPSPAPANGNIGPPTANSASGRPSSTPRSWMKRYRERLVILIALVSVLVSVIFYILSLTVVTASKNKTTLVANATKTPIFTINITNTSLPTINATSTLVSDTATAPGVVDAFCRALDSPTPDFHSAYDQLSGKYQQEHPLIRFQEYFQGTSQCTVTSRPNGKNEAEVSLTMLCPHRPPPPNGQPPPREPPSPRNYPANLTLINDESNDWKIDDVYVVGYDCNLPPSQP
jgi:serine/threonine protein kinase